MLSFKSQTFNKTQVIKDRTFFVATKFNFHDLQKKSELDIISNTVPKMIEVPSQMIWPSIQQIYHQDDQSFFKSQNNIFLESRHLDRQQFREWKKEIKQDDKGYMMRRSMVGRIELTKNNAIETIRYQKALTSLTMKTSRQNINHLITPAKTQFTEQTSQTSKSQDGEGTNKNFNSQKFPDFQQIIEFQSPSLGPKQLTKKQKRVKVVYESSSKQELLTKIQTLHDTIAKKTEKSKDQLQDRFIGQLQRWNVVNQSIINKTLRQPSETLFSRLEGWRSHIEDKEKIESMKSDIHFLGEEFFSSTLRQSDFKQKNLTEQQAPSPKFNLNLKHKSSHQVTISKKFLSSPSPINRYIPSLHQNEPIEGFEDGLPTKKISKSKKEVEIVRNPYFKRDLTSSNIKSQLFLKRKPNLMQQSLQTTTSNQWANPDKQIDSLQVSFCMKSQINGENVLMKEWRSLKDDRNNYNTRYEIIKQEEGLGTLNESIDKGYL